MRDEYFSLLVRQFVECKFQLINQHAADVERFVIEFLRAKDDRFLGPFTLAQLTSVILVAVGAYILTLWRDDPEPDQGDYLKAEKESLPSKSSTGKEVIGGKGVTSVN